MSTSEETETERVLPFSKATRYSPSCTLRIFPRAEMRVAYLLSRGKHADIWRRVRHAHFKFLLSDVFFGSLHMLFGGDALLFSSFSSMFE